MFGRVRWSLAVAGLLVLALTPVIASAQTDAERQLSEARAALERIADELSAAEDEVTGAEGQLADAEERLAEIEAIVNQVAADVERQRVIVRDAERRLADIEAEEAALQEAFGDRIARLFKEGPDLTFEALLNSEGADELIARTELLDRIVEGDQVDLERLDAIRITADAQRQVVAEEEQRLAEDLAEQEAVLAEAEELRNSRALAAEDARQRAREIEEEHDELADEEAELEALIERQQEGQRRKEAAERRRSQRSQATSSAPAPRASSGGYAWPMCAPTTSEYGPRWGRMHRGLDLGAGTGTPIRAAKAGRVIYANWQGGYGRLTLIDHGDGVVTAYAHQSRFAVGAGSGVSQGQVIGYVGTSGNVTGAHLHFETRVGGTAVNPRQYLSGSPC
ncbi:MAG: peptidoglycan DD-metalloendopeptidase family protein [Nitriliruptoraceae bacterium]